MQAILDFVLQRLADYWHKPRWGAATVILGGIIALVAVTQTGAMRPTIWGWIIVAAVMSGLAALWVATNRLPKVPRNRVGIVLAVTCDDDQHDKQVRADFISNLRALLERDPHGAKFFVITLPPHLAKHIAGNADAERFLRRLRAHMVLFGTVRKRRVRGEDVHVLNFDGLVRHAPATESARKELSSQFGAVVPRRWILSKDADVFAFEVTSQWTDVAARYIIGLAALMSGDLEFAEVLLLEVESQIRIGRPALPPLRMVGQVLPQYISALYSTWVQYLVDKFTTTRDETIVPEIERTVDKLLIRVPRDTGGHLAKAMCHFLLRRDVDNAIKSSYAARSDTDVTWQYNVAFLEAYRGNLDNAESEYEAAFQKPLANVTVPTQCEEFIQIILQAEPEKVQLHYCSGLINYHAKGDMSGAVQDLQRFVAANPEVAFPMQVRRARQLLTKAESGS